MQSIGARMGFIDFMLLPVPLPRGVFVGLRPLQTKLQVLPNWKMKHYKSDEILSIFRVSSPRTNAKLHEETKSPPIENFLATVLRVASGKCH